MAELKIIVWLYLLTALLASHAHAYGLSQDIVLYKNTSNAETPQTLGAHTNLDAIKSRLASGKFVQSLELALSAKVLVKTSDRELIDNIHGIQPLDAQDGSRGAWRKLGSDYLWQQLPGSAADSHPIKLAIPADNYAQNYDEMWLDYEDAPGFSLCNPALYIQGMAMPYGQGKQPVSIGAGTVSAPLQGARDLINIADAEWQPKRSDYLAKRTLGLAADSVWRYTQNNAVAVLQRRFDKKLSGWDVLELESRHGIARVNLQVSLDGGAPVLLEFTGLGQSLPDGRPGVRLDLRRQLEQRFALPMRELAVNQASHTLHLKEMIVFLPGDAAALVSSKVLRQLSFKTSPMFTLETQIETLSGGKHRLRVNLRNLSSKGAFTLSSMAWSLVPSGTACAIRLLETRGLSLKKGKVPKFVLALEDWSSRHGGPFLQGLAEAGKLESPGLLAILPFSVLATQDTRDASPFKLGFGEGVGFHTSDDKVLDPQSKAASQGAVIQVGPAAKGDSTIWRKDNWLVVEGSAPEITVDWVLDRPLPAGSHFFLDIPSGVENLGRIELQLRGAAGNLRRFPLAANIPVVLEDPPAGVIHSARLVLTPKQVPYSIKLNEAVLFAPQLIEYAQAFKHQALPYLKFVEPKVEVLAGEVISPMPGRAVILHQGKTARFRTDLQPGLDWLQGLMLNYRLPLSSLKQDCQVNLRLEWARGVTERQLCFNKPSDAIRISGAWLADASRSLGALQAVVWDLPALPEEDRSVNATELNFSFEGIALQTAESLLNHASLATIGDQVLRPAASAGVDQPYQRRMSVPLSNEWFKVLLAENATGVRVTENEFFTLDSIVATPVSPLGLQQWQELTAPPPSESAPSRWPQWLLGASALLLAWASARRGWWLPSQAWLYAKGMGYLLYWLLSQGLYWLGRRAWQRLHWLNLAVGLSVVPGLWLAGRLAGEYSGWMLLSATLMLAWAVARHRLIGIQKTVQEAIAQWLKVDRMLALVAVGNVLWALGKFGATKNLVWACLPVLVVGYLMLPYLYCLALAWERLWPGLGRWLAWSAATLFLYIVGLAMPVRGGENYFFTFGGMAAVLGLRAYLLLLEPWLRRVAPTLTEPVFRGSGSVYFSSALLGLIVTALLLSLKLEPVAEQLAVVVYYCLVLGTVLELIALRRERKVEEAAT